MAVVNDDFNSYNNGDLTGQGGWETYSAVPFQVQGSVMYEGAKAISVDCNQANGGSQINFDATSTGAQVFYFRCSATSAKGNIFIFDSGSNQGVYVYINDTSGKLQYYDNSSAIDICSISADTWYRLEIAWRVSDNTVRFRVGSSEAAPANVQDWTEWDTTYGLSTANLSLLKLRHGNSSGTLYFDYLHAPSNAYTADCTETLSLTAPLTASGGYRQTITDTLNMSDAQTNQADYLQTLTDILNLVDSVSEKSDFKLTLSEILNLTTTASTARDILLTITDTLNLSDSMSVKSDFKQTLTETLSLSDALTAIGQYTQTINDILTLTDALSVQLKFNVTLLETLVLSDYLDTLGRFWNWASKNTATWTQATKGTTGSWTWQDKREP